MRKIVKDFLSVCNAVDTESTGLDTSVAEICELGTCFINENSAFQIDSQLFGTVEPIPFGASAKNNISRRMIKGKKTFLDNISLAQQMLDKDKFKYYISHNIRYDQKILNSHFQKANIPFEGNWICTYRLAKQLFSPNDERPDMSYSLSYLRYCLNLDIPEDFAVHRAGDDAFVCMKLLECICEYVIDNFEITNSDDLGEFLFGLSSSPIIYEVANFGKYKGDKLIDIAKKDPKYLIWCCKNMSNLQKSDINFEEDLYASILGALGEVLE